MDGFPKKCSEGPTAQIDKEFQALLIEAGIPFCWTDLSSELAIPPGELHASHACLEQIRSVVREGKEDAAIVLGSGSITDLVKHALHLEGRPIPFVSIPTALTVTAFTSAFAIIDFHGAKRTLQSRPVSAAFWVRPFLECAPASMSRAGYGDLLARFVAYGDWLLGHRLGVMERYDESAFRLMEPFAGGIREAADGFAGYPLPQEATACTAAALAMAGISMSTAGETTPLSGFEHVISHALDFLRLTAGRELVFHGEQVASGLPRERPDLRPAPGDGEPQRRRMAGCGHRAVLAGPGGANGCGTPFAERGFGLRGSLPGKDGCGPGGVFDGISQENGTLG